MGVMIDHDDGDFAFLASMGFGGWFALVLVILAITFWIIADQNEAECKAYECLDGGYPRLIDGECLCVGEPVK